MEIRKVTERDIEGAARVHSLSAYESYKGLMVKDSGDGFLTREFMDSIFSYSKLCANWGDYIKAACGAGSGKFAFAAIHDGHIIGVVRSNVAVQEEEYMFKMMNVPVSKKELADMVNIKTIYVDPGYQKMGAGTALVKACSNAALGSGCSSLMTVTLRGYEESPRFFQKIGTAELVGEFEHDAGQMYRHGGGVKAASRVWKMSMDSVFRYKSSALEKN